MQHSTTFLKHAQVHFRAASLASFQASKDKQILHRSFSAIRKGSTFCRPGYSLQDTGHFPPILVISALATSQQSCSTVLELLNWFFSVVQTAEKPNLQISPPSPQVTFSITYMALWSWHVAALYSIGIRLINVIGETSRGSSPETLGYRPSCTYKVIKTDPLAQLAAFQVWYYFS